MARKKQRSTYLLTEPNWKELSLITDLEQRKKVISNAEYFVHYEIPTKKKQEAFSGSNRELRGDLLKLLLSNNKLSLKKIEKTLSVDREKLLKATTTLEKDGIITVKKNNLVEINS